MHFQTTIRLLMTDVIKLAKVVPNNLKGKSKSSQEWLARQLSDPYVEKAKMQNYRCRSAFKLIEIDDKAKFLTPGAVVVDCGAAPGSWSQVAVLRTNAEGASAKPKGIVIGIDRLQIYPIKGAHTIGDMDFTLPDAQECIKRLLDYKPVNMVISDMAPNATGIRDMDQENIISLCYSAFRFAVQVSAENAGLLVKVWDGKEVPMLEKDLAKFYKTVRAIKPAASRSDSSERFLLARGFKGLQT